MASPAASSPEIYTSAEELAEELEYQKVLLLSIDDNVLDREAAEAAIKAEIYELEKKLKSLKQAPWDSGVSTNVSASLFSDDPSTPWGTEANSHRGMGAPPSRFSPYDATASLSASTSHNLLSPSQIYLPTRKRSHEEQIGFDESENKYRRTTPSPHITRTTTPSEYSGQNRSVKDEGYVDPNSVDDRVQGFAAIVRQRQKELEEKANRERDDAEYARQLQDEISGTGAQSSDSSAGPSTGNSGPSAYTKIMGLIPQNIFPSIAGSPRTSGISSNAQHPTEGISSSNSSAAVINAKPVFTSRAAMPGDFVESTSDSEIEIIGSDAFQPNNRKESSLFSSGLVNSADGSVHSSFGLTAASPFQSPADAARQAAFLRAQNPLQYNSYAANALNAPFPSGHLLGSVNLPALSKGVYARQGPPGLYIPGSTPYSPFTEAPASSVYPNFANPASIMASFPSPSDSSIIPNPDPLSRILQATGYNMGSMVDIHGNPVSAEMSELDDALNGRLSEINDYVHDPRRTATEIQNLLENIRPDIEIPKENREGTPDGLKYALYEHQKLALSWLKQMEEGTNKGGILADDMGLGKTISALALILSRPSENRRRKTTLIIGPVSLVRQWEREIKTKINNSHRLSTFLYHSGKKATWESLRNFDIVLTTYGTIAAEWNRKLEWRKKCTSNKNLDYDAGQDKFPFLGDDCLWYRVILDEAQCIKNKATKAAQGTCYLKSQTRFCLTGTPMMNGVHELYSLIHFLRIRPYNEFSNFVHDFGCLSRAGGSRNSEPHDEKKAMKKLQAVLKAILLRRTKKSQIDGKPILTLPEKTEEIVHAVFNEDEQAYYTALETKTRLQFNKYLKANSIGKNYSNILVLLLRMRQAACHPHLIMDFEEAPPDTSSEDMVLWAKSLLPDVVRRIINAVLPFECPVCYDPVPNPRIAIPCGHDTCSECIVRIAGNVQHEAIAEGNEAGNAKCPTCRGKVDMKKIIDYETFKKVHMPQAEPSIDEDETESEDDSDSIDISSESDSTESIDVNSDGDIRNFVVPDGYTSSMDESDNNDDGDEDGDLAMEHEIDASNGREDSKVQDEEKLVEDEDDEEFLEMKDLIPAKKESVNVKEKFTSRKPKHRVKGKSKDRGKGKGKGKGKAKDQSKVGGITHLSLAQLKRGASKSAEGHRQYMRYLRKNWVSSAKVDKCLEILRDTPPDVKTIIFSQFTTLLDLLEVPIREKKCGFRRYDGSMSGDARHHSVVNFTDDPNCKVMLVSLKAGNAGLNLVAASQVIILDPFWNPFIEMQAVDRAHRIGQQKPVKVHRILVAGTVEDRIIELQEKKRKLVESALDEKASQGLGRLGRRELIYLFNGGAERQTASRPSYVPGLGPTDSVADPSSAAASSSES